MIAEGRSGWGERAAVRVRSDRREGGLRSGPLLQEDGGSTELGALERGWGGDGERPAGQL